MNAIHQLAEELLEALTKQLRTHPTLRDELRSILAIETNPSAPIERTHVTVSAYAEHLGLSKRTIENLIREGLPLVGRGRRRRIPIVEADAWMKNERGDAAIERRARRDAQRSATARLQKI
jgi:excisionase family DNA binding protein